MEETKINRQHTNRDGKFLGNSGELAVSVYVSYFVLLCFLLKKPPCFCSDRNFILCVHSSQVQLCKSGKVKQ